MQSYMQEESLFVEYYTNEAFDKFNNIGPKKVKFSLAHNAPAPDNQEGGHSSDQPEGEVENPQETESERS
mgnify:CR=1 FL=1